MTCPPEISDVLLEILHNGLLAARAAAWNGDAPRSAVETDHVHNLPDMVREFAPEKLQYYMTVEIPCYREKVSSQDTGLFEPLWDRLDELLASPVANS